MLCSAIKLHDLSDKIVHCAVGVKQLAYKFSSLLYSEEQFKGNSGKSIKNLWNSYLRQKLSSKNWTSNRNGG